MAVLKGWEASIVVGGRKLPEYNDPDDDTNEAGYSSLEAKVTKYIEAVSGSNFVIKCGLISKPPPGDNAFNVDYFVDGAFADGFVEEPKEYFPDICSVNGIMQCTNGRWTLQKFRFAAIIHDENQDANASHFDVSSIAKLGTIEIKIYRSNIISRGNQAQTYNEHTKLSGSSSIPEKALKGCAKSHQASLDNAESVPAVTVTKAHKLDPEHPDVTFIFRYRSHRALQTEGVIPRSPSPLPLEDRPEESLTREELLELLRRRPIPTKPETKPDLSARATVKRERDPEVDEIISSARAYKIGRKDSEIEVIDLLDD